MEKNYGYVFFFTANDLKFVNFLCLTAAFFPAILRLMANIR